jgi:hypothetical protein
MRAILIFTIGIVIAITLTYLCFGFVMNNYNPNEWSTIERGLLVISSSILSVIFCAIIDMNYLHKKQ